MASIFKLSERFGGGLYPSFEAADAVYREKLEEGWGYCPRQDIIEFVDGKQVFFNGKVAASKVDAVHAAVAKLSKKALKLGLAPLSIEVGPEELVREPADGGFELNAYAPVKVYGPEVKLAGYEFLGRVDHESGVALVCAVPGKEIPAQYREVDNLCDHCHQKRVRKSYYIFKSDEGASLKVGSTCLKDYMGHNAAGLIWLAGLEKELRGDEDEEGWGRGGAVDRRVRVIRMLVVAAAVIRERGGFVSAAAAQKYAEKSGGVSHIETTSSLVAEQLNPPPRNTWEQRGFKPVVIQEVDRRTVQGSLKWFKAEVATKSSLSDYEYNLNTLISVPQVDPKRAGLLVSLIGIYLRAMGQIAERAQRVNEYIGEVGQRRNFTGKFVSQNSFEGQYGMTYFTKLTTEEGFVTVKSSTDWWAGVELEKDAVLSFKATIIKHEEYKGMKSTMVNRAALLPGCAPQQNAVVAQ